MRQRVVSGDDLKTTVLVRVPGLWAWADSVGLAVNLEHDSFIGPHHQAKPERATKTHTEQGNKDRSENGLGNRDGVIK